MQIYDGSMVDVACYRGSSLIGFEVGKSSSYRCPFCGAIPHPRIFTKDKCKQCGAEYNQSVTGSWYWERDIEGERQMLLAEVEHLKLMLEGEEESHKTTKLFLERAKGKITGRPYHKELAYGSSEK